MTSDSIDVDLRGEHVGVVTRTPAGAQLSTAPAALAKHGLGSTVLTLGLPLDSSPASVEATEAFFGGLLPEGPRLEALLRDTPDTSRDKLVSLLYAAGRDVTGGIVLPGPTITALGTVLTEEEAALEVANPRGYLAGGGSGMSGMQPKVAMARSPEGWHAARDGHPSSHIIGFHDIVHTCVATSFIPCDDETWPPRIEKHVIVLAIVAGGRVCRMSVTEAATRLNLSPASCGRNVRFAECRARSARGRRHHVTIKDMNVTTAHDEPAGIPRRGWFRHGRHAAQGRDGAVP